MRSYLLEPDTPAQLPTNIHPQLTPASHHPLGTGQQLGPLATCSGLSVLTLSWPIFPELTGPRAFYYMLLRMGYLWVDLARFMGHSDWLLDGEYGTKMIWSAVISSGRSGGSQGYLSPRTKYFFHSVLFVWGYRTAHTVWAFFFFF